MISYKDELQHSGIKGMRWGIRKYRNYDGTLTPAGKERYDYSDGDRKSGSATKVSRREVRAEKKVNKAREAKKEAKAAAKEAKQAAAELKKEREALEAAKANQTAAEAARERINLQKLSNDELDVVVKRMELEKKYNDYLNPPAPATKSKLEKAKDFLGTVSTAVGSIKSIATSVSEINKLRRGEAGDSNKALKLAEETARLKASMDKANYEMETRARTRAGWREASVKQDTPSWANPSSNYNFKSQQHAASEWTKESRIFGLPSGSSETKSRSDHGSVWASRSGLLGLPAPSSSSNSSSSEPRVVGYYDPDGKFHRT